MKVAFSVIGGAEWTGGINYLANLLSALQELDDRPVEPLLFVGNDVDERALAALLPFVQVPPIRSELWNGGGAKRQLRRLTSLVLQRDVLIERVFRDHGVDLAFQHGEWYGCLFRIPAVAWIADFQHRHLPSMFSRLNYLKREVGYTALSYCAPRLMVSSEDARRDCARFYPRAAERICVVPFAVRISATQLAPAPEAVATRYALPERFFFLPNQFWKHKNHLGVVEALRICRAEGVAVVVAVSGNPADIRNPDHPQRVLHRVDELGLRDAFRVLGMIPYEDIVPLMRASVAVINPSLFEGWSTTVEEAKALGVPLLLSDLGVHREQAPRLARFFDPRDPASMAAEMIRAWTDWPAGPRPDQEAVARVRLKEDRAAFANRFVELVRDTIRSFRRSRGEQVA